MNKYEVLSVIGEGTYGIVLKCRRKKTGELVAIKKFKESEDDELVRKTTLREVKMLRTLRQENIVLLKEAFRRSGRLYLVFEYVEKNLLEVLDKNPDGLDPELIRWYMWQLAKAIDYCHRHDVIHRDIKPENILIGADQSLKLCDFGFARNKTFNRSPYTDYVATRWYRAPELLLATSDYDEKVDIWAMGCIMGELIDGHPLFAGDSEIDQLYVISAVPRKTWFCNHDPYAAHFLISLHIDKHRYIIQKSQGQMTKKQMRQFYQNPHFSGYQFPKHTDANMIDRRYAGKMDSDALAFMKSLLQMDPTVRPTGADCLRHPYFARYWERELASRESSYAARLMSPTFLRRPNTSGAVSSTLSARDLAYMMSDAGLNWNVDAQELSRDPVHHQMRPPTVAGFPTPASELPVIQFSKNPKSRETTPSKSRIRQRREVREMWGTKIATENEDGFATGRRSRGGGIHSPMGSLASQLPVHSGQLRQQQHSYADTLKPRSRISKNRQTERPDATSTAVDRTGHQVQRETKKRSKRRTRAKQDPFGAIGMEGALKSMHDRRRDVPMPVKKIPADRSASSAIQSPYVSPRGVVPQQERSGRVSPLLSGGTGGSSRAGSPDLSAIHRSPATSSSGLPMPATGAAAPIFQQPLSDHQSIMRPQHQQYPHFQNAQQLHHHQQQQHQQHQQAARPIRKSSHLESHQLHPQHPQHQQQQQYYHRQSPQPLPTQNQPHKQLPRLPHNFTMFDDGSKVHKPRHSNIVFQNPTAFGTSRMGWS